MQNKHFICFKNQKLDEDSLINFCKNFGNLESYPEKNKTKKNIQIFNVANISADGEHLNENDPRVVLQKNNSRWHTDSSYRFYPALYSLLFGKETLPKEASGGQTQFSNMLLAYKSLPEDIKSKIYQIISDYMDTDEGAAVMDEIYGWTDVVPADNSEFDVVKQAAEEFGLYDE